MPDDFVDPYVYPGTTVLRNLLDERDPDRLEHREYQLTLARRMELADEPIAGPFDLARWTPTHRRLFQDVLDQVAHVSRRSLAWRNITSREHLTASIRAFNASNGTPFRPILELVRRPPLDGLSPLDPSAYQVSKPR